MSAFSCVPIGRPEEFGERAFIAGLARATGDPHLLETCDVRERYGNNILEDGTVASFFRKEDGAARPMADVRRMLDFYRRYPTVEQALALSRGGSRAAPEEGLGGPDDEEKRRAKGFLDIYYGLLKRAHGEAAVPFYYPEESRIIEMVLNALSQEGFRSPEELLLAVFGWACSSELYPEPFFKKLFSIPTMSSAASDEQYHAFQKAFEMLSRCSEETFPARRWAVLRLKAKVEEELKKRPAPLEIGTVLPVPRVVEAAKRNRASVILLWAPWDMKSLHTTREIFDLLDSRTLPSGVGVVGVHLAEDGKETAFDRKRLGIPWPEVGLPRQEFLRLSPAGTWPLIIVVDGRGRMIGQLRNYDAVWVRHHLEEAVRSLLPEWLLEI